MIETEDSEHRNGTKWGARQTTTQTECKHEGSQDEENQEIQY